MVATATLPSQPERLSPADLRAALALVEAMIPGSATIPAADETAVHLANTLVREFAPQLGKPWAMLHRTLDEAARLRTGKPFHALPVARQQQLLDAWQQDPVLRLPLTVASLIYKLAHFDRPDVYAAMGGKRNIVKHMEQPRWLKQIIRADEWTGPTTLECDVVVVGTGAGGAVVGKELAERGHAVVFVEEGEHYRRDAFTGSSVDAHKRFYRGAISLGNAAMPVYIGRLVGGSTAMNGGTCFRTPDWVLDRWCEDIGTDAFTSDSMARHFERVERTIDVAPTTQPTSGPIAKAVARGCDALGWSHFAIRRNVKGCEGQGFCDFGCRTDARRSMNVSYVPLALEASALCVTGLRAERVLTEQGRAVGIQGVSAHGRSLQVRAKVVVLAGGAVPTPMLLLNQGLANSSDQVGRNLTLHPSTGLSALMDEDINGAQHIPQSYGCDQYLRDGILITSALPDANTAAVTVQLLGNRLMDVLARQAQMATLGILIADQSRNGRVWRGIAGQPAITYNLTAADSALLHKGVVAGMQLLKAAGAKRFYPSRPSTPEVAIDAIAAYAKAVPAASDVGLLSYHPLGTCQMGKDPRKSVVNTDHQCHDVPGLYIVDGSTVPGPLGVNPQLTIMAMASRAAEGIAAALD